MEVTEKTIDHDLNIIIRYTAEEYTQEQLAEAIGVTQKKICELEKQAVCDDDTLDKISRELDTSIEWFKTYNPIYDVTHYNFTTTNTDNATLNSTNSYMYIKYINPSKI